MKMYIPMNIWIDSTVPPGTGWGAMGQDTPRSFRYSAAGAFLKRDVEHVGLSSSSWMVWNGKYWNLLWKQMILGVILGVP